jgi:ribosomal protein S18 acetylase RimI-like enzyme
MGEMRQMEVGDVSSVVDVHLASFTGFFLSGMGAPFLRKLYLSVLKDRARIALVYESEGAVVGFVAGVTDPRDYFRKTLEQGWLGFALASIPKMLKRPAVALQLLRRLETQRRASFEEGHALLMSIGVGPGEQGKGIGEKLVAAFLREAKSRGCSGVFLNTDAVNNDPVNRFYVRVGFRLSKTYTTSEKRRLNEYVCDLSGPQG